MSLLFKMLAGGGGSEVEKIIAEELANSDGRATKKGAEAVQLIVRRSLARVGSTGMKDVRSALSKKDTYDLEPLARHPITDVVISRQAKLYPSRLKGYRPGRRDITGQLFPGSGFRRGINYHVVFEGTGRQEVYIGAQAVPGTDIFENPKYKPKKEPLIFSSRWRDIFAKWQEEGDLYAGMSSANYLSAINAPTRSSKQRIRPKRPVIQEGQKRLNPLALFRNALRERLNR